MNQIEKKSPSGFKSLLLTFKDELHFGPYLFSVEPKGFAINDNINLITDDISWSQNEKYLALIEVKHNSSKNVTTSFLKLINTESGDAVTVATRDRKLVPGAVSNTGDVTFL